VRPLFILTDTTFDAVSLAVEEYFSL